MIHDIYRTYRGSKTRVKTRCGRTEDVKVGFFFIIIMDVLVEKARTNQSWAMLFADNLVLVSETVESRYKEQVSANNFLGSSKLCRPLTYTDTLTARAKITIIIAICNDKKISLGGVLLSLTTNRGTWVPGNIGTGEHRFVEYTFREHRYRGS